MTHTLDHTLDRALTYAGDYAEIWLPENVHKTLGRLMCSAGNAILYARKEDSLANVVQLARYMWMRAIDRNEYADLDAYDKQATMREDFDRIIYAEFNLADAKHQGMTPYNSAMSDDARAAILGEEVGEVARALIFDADAAVERGEELAEALVQTATTAAAWLARILKDQECDR